MATSIQALLANYYGLSDDMKTILEGIVSNVSDHTAIRFVQGALMDRPNVNPADWFSEEAQVAEVTIACMGISQLIEGEEGEAIASPTSGDRDSINLPGHQIEFLKLMRSKAKKLIVVITGGSAISSPEVHALADAIIYAWYPGESGGQAVGDLLFGKSSPSGKLPVTFVHSLDDLPPYEDYKMANRTYRYMQKEPLYPFGFGLGYAAFEYGKIAVSSTTVEKGDTLSLELTLENVSNVTSDEVVQVYVSKRDKSPIDPVTSLKGFRRVTIPANTSKQIKFKLDDTAFSQYDDKGQLQLKTGEYEIMIGSSTPFQRSLDLGAPKWSHIQLSVK